MPDGVFQVGVVTPEAALFEGSANGLVLRSSDGDLTILDGHTPLITDVVPDEVRIDVPEGDPVRLAVHGGYLQVETRSGLEEGDDQKSTRATLLAGVAELAEDIDVPRAQRAREVAQARVDELRASTGRGERAGGAGAPSEGSADTLSPEEIELASQEAALRRAEVRLAVAGVDTASSPAGASSN